MALSNHAGYRLTFENVEMKERELAGIAITVRANQVPGFARS
jgi:hypothetical protein